MRGNTMMFCDVTMWSRHKSLTYNNFIQVGQVGRVFYSFLIFFWGIYQILWLPCLPENRVPPTSGPPVTAWHRCRRCTIHPQELLEAGPASSFKNCWSKGSILRHTWISVDVGWYNMIYSCCYIYIYLADWLNNIYLFIYLFIQWVLEGRWNLSAPPSQIRSDQSWKGVEHGRSMSVNQFRTFFFFGGWVKTLGPISWNVTPKKPKNRL